MLGPMTYGVLSIPSGAAPAWDPSQATTDGGVSPHTWHYAGSGAVYQDDAESTLVASDGDVVGSSVNQGSDSHSVVQATTARKPLYKTGILNGEPVFRVDGIDDYLQGAFTAALAQPFTIFAVAQLDAAAVNDGNNRSLMDGNSLQNMLLRQRIPATPDSWSFLAGVWLNGGDSDSNWNMWMALANGASSQFWLNGVSEAAGDAGTDNPTGLTLGDTSGTGEPWDGDIAEIIVYDSNLSTADKNQVGNYLATKYGLSWTNLV